MPQVYSRDILFKIAWQSFKHLKWGEMGEPVRVLDCWWGGAGQGRSAKFLFFDESKRPVRLYPRVNSAMNNKLRTVYANTSFIDLYLHEYVGRSASL